MILKKIIHCAVLLLFLFFSFLFISPESRKGRSQFHSQQLRKNTITSEDKKRTDYVDADGIITIAADLGYATVIVTNVGNGRLERYYNDKGETIRRYNGYYAVFYEYDDKGNNIRISYLDIDDKPIIMANGYAVEEKEYNENGQTISVRYYDTDGNPILTPSYGYGKINEYTENGKISRIVYVDISGAPMMTGQGFASITRNYCVADEMENDKVESEFYFDEKGIPVSLSLGQYGVYKSYDEYGRESVLTYLDAEGKPCATNKGYTTVARTYHADNTIATEQYYDLEGKPFALSEGQYGIKNEGGQIVYLDINGNEMFNLKNILYNHSRMVILLALSFVIISSLAGTKQNAVFLVFCITAILYMTLLFRDNDSAGYSGLLQYYRRILFDSEARADIIKNIWLFIPLGAVLYRLYPKAVILIIPIFLSILIEGIQLFAGIGICELDDIISNSIGGWIGFSMGRLTDDFKQRISNRRQYPA